MTGKLMALLRGIENRLNTLWDFAEGLRKDLDRIENSLRGRS